MRALGALVVAFAAVFAAACSSNSTCGSGGTLGVDNGAGAGVTVTVFGGDGGSGVSFSVGDGASAQQTVPAGTDTVTAVDSTTHVTVYGPQAIDLACDGSASIAIQAEAVTLAIAVTGTGAVTSSPAGLDCTAGETVGCAATFPLQSTVMLTAAGGSDFGFAGWGGACSGNDLTCSVTLAQPESVTASFEVGAASLAVTLDGSGSGAVTSSPSGIDCTSGTCGAGYSAGTVVALTAAAATGSTFTGWGGACSGSGGCSVTVDGATDVTATFGLIGEPLTVALTGSGSGQVTSDVGSIACGDGSDACSANLPYDTMVTLTAAPDAGSTFAAWTGDCTVDNTTTPPSCDVTMTAAESVTAEFDLD